MNIQFQVAGFLITLVLSILYVSKRNLNLYSSKLFGNCISVTLMMLFWDMVSVIAISFDDTIPKIIVEIICKIYLVFLVKIVSTALLYISNDALGEIKHRKYTKVVMLSNVIALIIIFLLPISVYHEGRVVYSYGPCTTFVYGLSAFYFICCILFMLVFKKHIYKRRWFAFWIWLLSWISATAIQFMFSELLLVGFSGALGITVLYVMLENPETVIDRKLGCFNTYAMINYLNELFERNEPFRVFSFCFDEVINEQEELIANLLKLTNKYTNSYIFNGLNKDFLLVMRNESDVASIEKYIENEAAKEDSLLRGVHIAFMPNGLKALTSENVQQIFEHYHLEFHHVSGDVVNTITDQMIADFLKSNEMIEEIVLALEEDRVEVHLQPIYNIRSDTFTSAEALVRIRKDDGNLLPPGLFIPVAESTGLIVELGERIFEKVCKFISEYKPWEYGLEYIEVNLSILQCEQSDLSERLLQIMNKYGINPSRINLEITETATLNAKKKLLRNMDVLMKSGCTFSLDDFGKGESNLMYIVEMPVEIVKLDYDMTKAFHVNEKAKSVVKSVVNMAHEMGLHLVAEGIENEKELSCMREVGVDYIQGYFFSKPLPVEQYYQFICENNK